MKLKRIALLLICAGLCSCQTTSDNTRTTTVSPDGTQTIVENIDPFVILQKACLERKFE
jgi:hypothetical protein